MFSVPLSAYAGYPHRTPKISLCPQLNARQDHVYTFVSASDPEIAVSEDRRAARRVYADTIALDQLQRLQRVKPILHPRSLSESSVSQRPRRRVARCGCSPPGACCGPFDREEAPVFEEDEEGEIQRRRHQLFAEQAHASRMRAREHAFAQALRVAHKLTKRSSPTQTSKSATELVPAATAAVAWPSGPRTLRLLRIAAAPADGHSRPAASQKREAARVAPGKPDAAIEALENLESELAALPQDLTAACRKHLLTQLLERADAVESGGHDSVRLARRAFVCKVQAALDDLEMHR